jgi:hypothetical protein
MRLIPRFILPLVLLMLIISYQNFSSVSPQEWDSTSTLKVLNEMNEFSRHDPQQKAALATPQSGRDLKSVSNDWMQRQGSIILNGYDKKLESAMNDKLNSWVQEITRKDTEDEAPKDPKTSAVNDKNSSNAGSSPSTKKTKQNIRFSRVNSLKYEVGDASSFGFTADPGNTHLDFNQSLSSNTKMGVEHRTNDNQTQMFFKYEW